MTRAPDSAFWRGKRVLLTGHTGFKGAWTCLMLEALGADVIGLSLSPAELGAFAQLGIAARLRASYMVDIRDAAAVAQVVQKAQPDVVIHMAAQALVGEGYRDPAGTFATNVNGTIHLLQALRGWRRRGSDRHLGQGLSPRCTRPALHRERCTGRA